MDRLHTLPPELWIWVFVSLDNIDDALHLARCCKYLHLIFYSENVRLKVFRSIIAYSSHHQNDLHLCQAINMHAQFSAEFYSSSSIPENPERRQYHASSLEPLSSGLEIPADIVWDIVSRWHGSRLLFDLYCDEAVSREYACSIFSYSARVGTADTTEISANEGDLPEPSGVANPCARGLGQRDKNKAYEPFYTALTSHWLSVERLWQVRSQAWPKASAFNCAFEHVLKRWTNNPQRSLQMKLEIVEIVDFVWGFLGRKSFHVSSLPTWIDTEGDHIEEQYIDGDDDDIGNWGFFVRAVLQFLRPPQIIELVMSQWCPSQWRLDRPMFLRSLGLFDVWEGIYLDGGGISMLDSWVPMNLVDDDVVTSLKDIVDTDTVEEEWGRYREGRWLSEVRGKLFFKGTLSQEILTSAFSHEKKALR